MAFASLISPARAAASAAVLLTALMAAGAHGADKKPAPPAAAPAKTPLLTPEQLRDCVAQKEKVTKDTEAAVKSKAAVAAQKAEIDSTGKALEDEAATLDRTSEDAVAAFNAKVIERNGKVDAYRARAEAYNVEVESVLAAKDAYEKACANRRFDDRDLNDLQKKK
ncbi:MAG TPA: hypothetical protein VLD35_04255 [Caldimonas sp.]|nr:hypothetical protein [Caldimonas sp.]